MLLVKQLESRTGVEMSVAKIVCVILDVRVVREKRLREWAESEYIEKPVISRRDRAFLECFRECAKWMTRDGDGTISVWDDKPNKSEPFKMWMNGTYNCVSMFNIDFPMVKWSDSEPWLIEDLKKLEVVEDYE